MSNKCLILKIMIMMRFIIYKNGRKYSKVHVQVNDCYITYLELRWIRLRKNEKNQIANFIELFNNYFEVKKEKKHSFFIFIFLSKLISVCRLLESSRWWCFHFLVSLLMSMGVNRCFLLLYPPP